MPEVRYIYIIELRCLSVGLINYKFKCTAHNRVR